MPHIRFHPFVLFLSLFCFSSAHASMLDGYLFDTRPLILFSISADDPAFKQQLRILAGQSCELFVRDIELMIIVSGEANELDGQALNAAEVDFLRQELEVEPYKHLVVLVGKDGRVKLRAHMPLSMSDLLLLIDAMPMVRTERLQHSKNPCHSA